MVALPTAQNDAQQQEKIVGTDGVEELLESNRMLKLQGLTVENGSGLFMNGLADTQDGWSEVINFFVVGLVNSLQEHLSSTGRLGLFVKITTSNHLLTCVARGEESERGGVIFENKLVDHDTDFKRKLHETKGNVLERLLGLSGCALTLVLCGLCIIRSIMVRSCCIEALCT